MRNVAKPVDDVGPEIVELYDPPLSHGQFSDEELDYPAAQWPFDVADPPPRPKQRLNRHPCHQVANFSILVLTRDVHDCQGKPQDCITRKRQDLRVDSSRSCNVVNGDGVVDVLAKRCSSIECSAAREAIHIALELEKDIVGEVCRLCEPEGLDGRDQTRATPDRSWSGTVMGIGSLANRLKCVQRSL